MLGEGMSRDYPKRSYTSRDRMGSFCRCEGGWIYVRSIRYTFVSSADLRRAGTLWGARGLFPIFVARRTWWLL